MAYKKPKMVAKSSAKKSYVAGCPEKTYGGACKAGMASSCELERPN